MDVLIRTSRRPFDLLDIIPPESPREVGGVGCQGCGAEPQFEVLAHMLDCEDDETAGHVDQDGNFVWRGCSNCYASWRQDLVQVLARLQLWLPVQCDGCGKPIASVGDIMLRVRRL